MVTLFNIIKNSSDLLVLKKEEEELDYPPISLEVYKRSLSFLLNNINYSSLFDELNLKEPRLNKCIDGSIDISWRFNNYRLLVNINDLKISWYGDKGGDIQVIKGKQENSLRTPLLYEWINNNLNIHQKTNPA
jgi:hypothetical protein